MGTFERRLGDGRVHGERGDWAAAEEALRDALDAAEGTEQASAAHAALGVVLDRSGNSAEAERQLRLALQLADGGPERPGVEHDLGIVLLRRGASGEAAPLLESAARDATDDLHRARSVEALGHALLELDRLREAESAFAQLAFLADRIDAPARGWRADNGRGEALRRMGRRGEAWAAFQGVVTALSSVRSPSPEQSEQAGVALHGLGVLALESDPDQARALLSEAVSCFERSGGRQHPHAARSLAFLAWLDQQAGDTAAAADRVDDLKSRVRADDPVVTQLLPELGLVP